MKKSSPLGWDEEKAQDIAEHYESQSEDEAVFEDEAAFSATGYAIVSVPREILHKVLLLIQDYEAETPMKKAKKK
jgi:hypothetical protein